MRPQPPAMLTPSAQRAQWVISRRGFSVARFGRVKCEIKSADRMADNVSEIIEWTNQILIDLLFVGFAVRNGQC